MKAMDYKYLNGIRTFAPSSRENLLTYAMQNKQMLIAINAEKIYKANDKLKSIINQNIGYPDGIGAVWALQKKGCANVPKIPGCELWLDLIKKYYKQKSFYLIGGKQEVIDFTVTKLRKDFPGINIVNYRNGYINSEVEQRELIRDIARKKPDVVFVAMGTPKQEFLMNMMMSEHPAVYQGLGGSFDVYSGQIPRAPKWWIDNNLEWAFRLVKQPSRIVRQRIYLNFFLKLKLNMI